MKPCCEEASEPCAICKRRGGGSFGDVLKFMLRRWSGHPYCWMTALSASAVAIEEAAVSMAHFLHVAQAVGSEDEVMRISNSSDVLGVVLARNRLFAGFFEALLPFFAYTHSCTLQKRHICSAAVWSQRLYEVMCGPSYAHSLFPPSCIPPTRLLTLDVR